MTDDLDRWLAERLGIDFYYITTTQGRPFSHTWAGAGRVVEAMGERIYRLELNVVPDVGCTATFWDWSWDTNRKRGRAKADTAPEAIALAARAALEEEDG